MDESTDAIRFGRFEFDRRALVLREDGAPVHLQPKPSQVLALLLSKPGRLVTRDELQETVWSGSVIEFDAGLNFSIRMVRKALGDSAESPSYIETVPRRGYRFIAPVDDLAVLSAPVGRRRVGGRYGLGLVATLAVLLVAAFMRQGDAVENSADGRLLLAVLPFQELGNEESLQFFSRGLTEDLITELATLSPERLGVISSRSSGSFGEQSPGLDEVRATLGVDYVVRGSVREEDLQRRVTIRLESTQDGIPVWAASYDQQPGQELAVQSAIARGIAKALSLEILGTVRSARVEDLPPDAQESFLMARWLVGRSTRADIERGLAHVDSIRTLAPEFAPAWALTARGLNRLGSRAPAEEAARRAVELDPVLAAGHFQLGQVLQSSIRLDESLTAFQKAVELAPGIARYRQAMAYLLGNLLQFDDAIRNMKLARELDPVSTIIDIDLAWIYLGAGRWDDAVQHCLSHLELMPDSPWARHCLLGAHYFAGDPTSAFVEVVEVMRLDGATPSAIDALNGLDAEAGLQAYFRWDLERLQADEAAGKLARPYDLARAHARLEARGETMAILCDIIEARSFSSLWIAKEIWFNFLHGDPEFERTLRQAGLRG